MVVTCAIAVWGLLVSPTTWAHHWVWCVPAIVTALVFVSRTDSPRVRAVYGSLAAVGTVIFDGTVPTAAADPGRLVLVAAHRRKRVPQAIASQERSSNPSETVVVRVSFAFVRQAAKRTRAQCPCGPHQPKQAYHPF